MRRRSRSLEGGGEEGRKKVISREVFEDTNGIPPQSNIFQQQFFIKKIS